MTRPRLALGDDLVCALAHGENVFIDVLSLGPAYNDVFIKTYIKHTCSFERVWYCVRQTPFTTLT